MKNLITILAIIFMAQINVEAQKTNETIVLIETTMGNLKVKLYDETPHHRDNFIKLVNEKYYDGVLFHRVIKDFMIQTGDPNSKNAPKGANLGSGGPNYTIPAEFNSKLIHKKGALAAARTGDNVNPNKESSGSQFYIVQGKVQTDAELNAIESRFRIKYTDEQRKAYKTVGGTPFLDMNYTVFGEVVEGLDLIDKIAAVKTVPGDRPEADIKILSTKIVSK